MPARTDAWRFEWCRSWADVWSNRVLERWQRAFDVASAPHVYHRLDLVRCWSETRGVATGAEAHVGIATSAAGAQVVLPWVVSKHRGRLTVRRTLEPVGADFFGYHTPLLAGVEPQQIDWPGFWDAARASVAGACDQGMFRLVEPEYAARPGMRLASEESPVLSLEGCDDLEAVLARCTSSHRVDVNRQLRRAREHGDVSLWTAGHDDAAEVLRSVQQELWPAYRAVWQGRPVENLLFSSGAAEFVERVVNVGVPQGWAHYSVLRIGTSPVAWHLGFIDSGRLYYWIPTHDMAWSKFSPGKLLLAELIARGCREGWREIHFLTGDQSYKRAWHPTPRTLTAVTWTAPTVRGQLMAWYDARSHAQ